MKRILANFFVGLVVIASLVGASNTLYEPRAAAGACTDSTFFVLPNWWRGLGHTSSTGGQSICVVDLTAKDGTWQTGVLTIALNILDGLLRLVGLIAVIFIIIGGIRYIISQGQPNAIAAAKTTIVRAVSGLAIAIVSVLILNYLAGTVFKLTVDQNNYQVCQTACKAQ